MNKLLLILICMGLIGITGVELGAYDFPTESEEKEDVSICPKTLMKIGCLNCHLDPGFELREETIEEKYNRDGGSFPLNFTVVEQADRIIGNFLCIGPIESNAFENVFNWLQKHSEIKYLRIEVFSGGGSMFGAKRIVSMMDEFKASGGTIEVRVKGVAASAAFLVLLNGTKGLRFIHPQAEVMWHELRTVEGWFPKLVTPADKETEAEIMRHWQDTQDTWIASKSKLSKDEITALIRYKDFWCNGKEAVEKYGFADKLIE